MEIGRRIFFDKQNGEVIIDTGERVGSVIKSSVEQDIAVFSNLSERNRSTFDFLELEYGDFSRDFALSQGQYKVDLETNELRFVYPDEGETENPVYKQPLSVELENLKSSLQSDSAKYDNLDKTKASLEVLKNARILKLKEECSKAIYDGFTSGNNEFGFNETDQVNFTQRMLTIVAGAPGPFEWKSVNNGVVELTKVQFTQVIQDAEAHKLNEQKKYWELEAEVLAAETNEEVDAVKW